MMHPEWPEGLRCTRPRERVLGALVSAEGPLAVHQIQSAVDADGGPPVWVSTLYRTLEAFVDADLVIRTSMPDGGQSVYELNRHDHRHYAFCVGCHKMVAVEHCPVDPDAAHLTGSDFHVTGHKLEVFGYCADCFRKVETP
jgi:Fur family ferric uptake transcriptional regulator